MLIFSEEHIHVKQRHISSICLFQLIHGVRSWNLAHKKHNIRRSKQSTASFIGITFQEEEIREKYRNIKGKRRQIYLFFSTIEKKKHETHTYIFREERETHFSLHDENITFGTHTSSSSSVQKPRYGTN